MKVLIDSSVWIDYFNQEINSSIIDLLIDENLVVTNEIILSELIPYLMNAKQKKLAKLLYELPIDGLSINWNEIISYQTIMVQKGFNGIGIPDLIIAQNSIQNNSSVFSNDKHFHLISKKLPIKIF